MSRWSSPEESRASRAGELRSCATLHAWRRSRSETSGGDVRDHPPTGARRRPVDPDVHEIRDRTTGPRADRQRALCPDRGPRKRLRHRGRCRHAPGRHPRRAPASGATDSPEPFRPSTHREPGLKPALRQRDSSADRHDRPSTGIDRGFRPGPDADHPLATGPHDDHDGLRDAEATVVCPSNPIIREPAFARSGRSIPVLAELSRGTLLT